MLVDLFLDLAASVSSPDASAQKRAQPIQIIAPIWRRSVDKRVRAHRPEHQEYLRKSGFFD
jgi:hypothetical protein